MIIRNLKDEERIPYQKLCRYAFGSTENNYENMEYPKLDTPLKELYGAFSNKDNELIAGSHCFEFDIKMRSKKFKVGGIAGVTTRPQHRNIGAIREIFQKLYDDMKVSNIPISILYPFKISYYEKLGYSIVDENILYQFKIEDIKINKKAKLKYRIQEVEEITDDIKAVYKKVCNKFDYIALRNDDLWSRKSKGNYKFVFYNENDIAEAYIIFSYPKDPDKWDYLRDQFRTLVIWEIMWYTTEAKEALFHFLWTHRDQRKFVAASFPVNEIVTDYLHSPRMNMRTLRPNSMLRIIDLITVLETIDYPVESFSFVIRVRDEQCSWNNGLFKFASNDGKVNVKKDDSMKESEVDLTINIIKLAQLLVGFRTINELAETKAITVKEDKKEKLQELFPKTNNFFRDFF